MMEPQIVYTLSEVALLFSVSRETVRRWIRAGQLSASRAGREYKVSRSDLAAFYRNRGGQELFQ
jgi:excisionase family DNA binding protein